MLYGNNQNLGTHCFAILLDCCIPVSVSWVFCNGTNGLFTGIAFLNLGAIIFGVYFQIHVTVLVQTRFCQEIEVSIQIFHLVKSTCSFEICFSPNFVNMYAWNGQLCSKILMQLNVITLLVHTDIFQDFNICSKLLRALQ